MPSDKSHGWQHRHCARKAENTQTFTNEIFNPSRILYLYFIFSLLENMINSSLSLSLKNLELPVKNVYSSSFRSLIFLIIAASFFLCHVIQQLLSLLFCTKNFLLYLPTVDWHSSSSSFACHFSKSQWQKLSLW